MQMSKVTELANLGGMQSQLILIESTLVGEQPLGYKYPGTEKLYGCFLHTLTMVAV